MKIQSKKIFPNLNSCGLEICFLSKLRTFQAGLIQSHHTFRFKLLLLFFLEDFLSFFHHCEVNLYRNITHIFYVFFFNISKITFLASLSNYILFIVLHDTQSISVKRIQAFCHFVFTHLCCCEHWHAVSRLSLCTVCVIVFELCKEVCVPAGCCSSWSCNSDISVPLLAGEKGGGVWWLSNALAAIWRVPLNCFWYFHMHPSRLREVEPQRVAHSAQVLSPFPPDSHFLILSVRRRGWS